MAAQKKILLVDDAVPFLATLQEALERKGYAILAAANVKDAIGLLQKYSDIDLVLGDYHLKGNSLGTDIGAWMRGHKYPAPFLLMSDSSEIGDFMRMVKDGEIAQFLKSKTDINAMAVVIENLLQSSQAVSKASNRR